VVICFHLWSSAIMVVAPGFIRRTPAGDPGGFVGDKWDPVAEHSEMAGCVRRAWDTTRADS
jgi:hypothetical protein